MTELNWVDVVLLAGTVTVAIAGWRSGLIATTASFAGFVIGAIAGARLAPALLGRVAWPPGLAVAATVTAMVVLGLIGSAVLGRVGRAVGAVVRIGPIRLLDSASGLVVSALAFLLSAWLLLSVVVTIPAGSAVDEVRASRAYPALEQVMSGPVGGLLTDARNLLAGFDLPALAFSTSLVPPVADPDAASVTDAVDRVAATAVVKVLTNSPGCRAASAGSGVLVGPGQVVTNAHVVAGAEEIGVLVGGHSPARPAVLVYRDAATDVAVLRVPDLTAPAPEWVDDVDRGTAAAIVGYPGGGPQTVIPARVRGSAELAEDGGTGLRSVLVFSGRVERGNSGGALLDPQGRVLGLVFARSATDDQTGFALAADEVRPAVRASRSGSEPVSAGPCPPR